MVVLLVDATRGLCPSDVKVLRRIRKSRVPALVALTKTDLLEPDLLAASHAVVSSDLEALYRAFPDSGPAHHRQAAAGGASGAAMDDEAVHMPKLRSPPLLLSAQFYRGVSHFWRTLQEELRYLNADERFIHQRAMRAQAAPSAHNEGRSMPAEDGQVIEELRTMYKGRMRNLLAGRSSQAQPSEEEMEDSRARRRERYLPKDEDLVGDGVGKTRKRPRAQRLVEESIKLYAPEP